jgi:hypothetical protein
MMSRLSQRIPAAIRYLWLLADGEWHTAADIATAARVVFQTSQTFLATCRYLGVLEVEAAESRPRYRVKNWRRFDEAVAPFRPYLDGSYAEALRQARAEVRERLSLVPPSADAGGDR